MKDILKRVSLALLCAVAVVAGVRAQVTKSYRYNYSYCPQTGSSNSVGAGLRASSLTFYDGYITAPPYGRKYIMASRNNDGSTTYAAQRRDTFLEPLTITVSADLLTYVEVLESNFSGLVTTIYNYHTYIGEGDAPARDYSNRGVGVRYGPNQGGSSPRSRSDKPSKCSTCGGTGVNPSKATDASRSSWRAYYNSSGTKCPYCNSYGEHYHDRCPRCNVPRY